MPLFPKEWCLASEAFQKIGRRRFGNEWTGQEINAPPPLDLDEVITAQYQASERRRVVTRNLLMEALKHGHLPFKVLKRNGQPAIDNADWWLPPRQIIPGFLLDPATREEVGIDVDEVRLVNSEAALRDLLNVSNRPGNDASEWRGSRLYVEVERLDQCLKEISPLPIPRAEKKHLTNEKHQRWLEIATEIAAQSTCPLFRGKPNVSEIARRIRKRGNFSEDTDTIRRRLNTDRSLWDNERS